MLNSVIKVSYYIWNDMNASAKVKACFYSSNSCTGNGTFELSYGTIVTMLREQMDNVDTNDYVLHSQLS